MLPTKILQSNWHASSFGAVPTALIASVVRDLELLSRFREKGPFCHLAELTAKMAFGSQDRKMDWANVAASKANGCKNLGRYAF
jgi:hypothetical protein